MQMKIQKKGFWNFISIIVFIACFIGIYMCLNAVFIRKDTYIKNGEFLNEENNFDVLFFGNSHAFDAIYPMELWNQYGIFSYNLAGASNEIAVSYWEMVNALDYSEPELVVFDCTALSSNVKVPQKNMNNIHKSLDFFPLTLNKIKAVNDLIEPDERIAFLWMFSLYHSRWSELTEEDFKWDFASDKGAELHVGVAVPNEKAVLDKSEKSPMDTVGVEYLRKIIESCQERDIEILLTYVPFPANEKKVREANLVYDIAEEYQVNYINFLDMDGIVDFDTDCYDNYSHLNPSGARKVTEYLGAYIQEKYKIKDRREDAAYASWHEDYEEYTAHKISVINKQESLDRALALLYDKNLNTYIFIKQGSEILQDERMVKLIKNVSPYAELEKIETAIRQKSDYLFAVNNDLRDVEEYLADKAFEKLGAVLENSMHNVNEEMPDVQIITINRLTGEIVNQSDYVTDGYDEYGNIVAEKVKE